MSAPQVKALLGASVVIVGPAVMYVNYRSWTSTEAKSANTLKEVPLPRNCSENCSLTFTRSFF